MSIFGPKFDIKKYATENAVEIRGSAERLNRGAGDALSQIRSKENHPWMKNFINFLKLCQKRLLISNIASPDELNLLGNDDLLRLIKIFYICVSEIPAITALRDINSEESFKFLFKLAEMIEYHSAGGSLSSEIRNIETWQESLTKKNIGFVIEEKMSPIYVNFFSYAQGNLRLLDIAIQATLPHIEKRNVPSTSINAISVGYTLLANKFLYELFNAYLAAPSGPGTPMGHLLLISEVYAKLLAPVSPNPRTAGEFPIVSDEG